MWLGWLFSGLWIIVFLSIGDGATSQKIEKCYVSRMLVWSYLLEQISRFPTFLPFSTYFGIAIIKIWGSLKIGKHKKLGNTPFSDTPIIYPAGEVHDLPSGGSWDSAPDAATALGRSWVRGSDIATWTSMGMRFKSKLGKSLVKSSLAL